jgi:predicted membrane protein
MFFADRLASDASSGAEILIGTPLRMPANPDRKSFKKIIAQVFFFFLVFIYSFLLLLRALIINNYYCYYNCLI